MTKMTEMSSATLITTADGETIPASDALCLNWDGVLARKLSVHRGPMQDAIQSLLDDHKNDPAIHAVSRPDTPHAMKIESALANIQVRRQPVPALWAPYLDAVANWQSRQSAPVKPAEAKPSVEDAKAAAVKAALDRANAKLARDQKRAEESQQAAANLAALSPAAALREQRHAECQAEKERMENIIRPYALGQATVDRNSRPTGLELDANTGVGISFAQDIATSIPDGCEPANLLVPCAFCGREHKLGDNFSFTMKKNGEEKRVTVFRAQLLWLAAKTEDGSADYAYRGGDKDGSPKKLPVLVCSDCAKIARDIGRDENLPREFMPNYGSALELVARAHLKAQAEKDAERGTRATLVASFGDMTDKGGRRDRRTHRNSAEE